MKDEYDFSSTKRGKFYREGAVFIAPIYVEADLLARLTALAQERGTSCDALLNEILEREVAALERAPKTK